GVNADGTVVVGVSFFGAPAQAFRWTAASGMVGLGLLGPRSETEALGVNADGTGVVGTGTVFPPAQAVGFRWTATSGMRVLVPGGRATGVNADGTVVVGGSGGQAFRWVNGTLTGLGFLPGGRFSEARGVNADGTVVVGSSSDASGRGQAFRWVHGTMTRVDFFPRGT